MSGFRFTLHKTDEFRRWHELLAGKERTRIDSRLDEVAAGHFGVSRSLSEGLFELKWQNGLRVYFSRKRIGLIDIIILWGGFKGSQDGDIVKARRLKTRYEDELKREIH